MLRAWYSPRRVLPLFVAMFAFTAFAASAGAEEDAWLGVMLQSLTDDLKEAIDLDEGVEGVLVSEVVDESPADEAGLMEGDVIVEIEGKPMDSVKDVVKTIRDHSAGDKVKIVILRDGRKKTLTAELEGKRREVKTKDFLSFPGLEFAEPGLCCPMGSWFEEQGFLGVNLMDHSSDLGEYFKVKEGEGVLVLEVIEDSPAAEAGIQAGDVVLEYDGEKVGSSGEFTKYVQETEPGESVKIMIKRKGRTKTMDVEVGEREMPAKHFMRAYKIPGKGECKRVVIPDIKRHLIRNLEDLEDLEDLEELKGFDIDIEMDELEDLEDAIEELKREMKKLKKELEALKEK